MEDNPDNGSSLPIGELREITLLIPGEHFFCECISCPESVEEKEIEDLVLGVLEKDEFSPYPVDQLAWGFYNSPESNHIFLFATPFSKLRNLGWQNLELFRRVFPSFVSLFGVNFEKPTTRLLLHEETLSAGCFEKECPVPKAIFSFPIDPEDEEALGIARGKLLSLVDLEHYDVEADILVLEEFFRTKDGFFKFEHKWLVGKDPKLELEQNVLLGADKLWKVDLRPPVFKETEQKRSRFSRLRWQAMVSWGLGMAAVLVLLAGVSYLKVISSGKAADAQRMYAEVPKVREDQKLLEKLRQNKLGGIDVFGALGRLGNQRGFGQDGPELWFSQAHFESRNEVKLEGQGKNVEAINTFIENLEKNKVANIRKNRSGEEIREIESDGGKTTFEIEFDLMEELPKQAASEESTLPKEAEPG